MTKSLRILMLLTTLTFTFIITTTAIAAPPIPPDFQKISKIKIVKLAIAPEIVDREPVGESDSFSADVGTLWCYTKITGAKGQAITHRWYFNGELMAVVPLEIKYDTYRTRSSKRILAYWKGPWRVEIMTESGVLLDTISFTIK
jgi:hypothetical protein